MSNTNTQRAYSKFSVKSINDAQRILEGIASTPATDRMSDIVEPLGASFDLPMPFLWQHDHEQPIGHVTHARPSADGIPVTVQLAKTDVPGTLRDRLEESWESLKLGLVRGLSIGFAPLEYSYMEDTGGYRFTRWSWLELSAVTIPANAEATITTIKRCDVGLATLSSSLPHPSRLPLLKQPAGSSSNMVELARIVGGVMKEQLLPVQRKLDALETEHARLKAAMAERKYFGVWAEGEQYREHNSVTLGGSLWICHTDTTDKPGTSESWRLAVRKGRDAR